MQRLVPIVIAIALGAAAVVAACGTEAQGVEACRQVEEARCRHAPGCAGIDLGVPVHADSPKGDVDACIRFYHDACLHGLVVQDPGGPAVQACIASINGGDCKIVAHPETAPACNWLIPPNTPPADAGDAAADAPPDAPAGASNAATDAPSE